MADEQLGAELDLDIQAALSNVDTLGSAIEAALAGSVDSFSGLMQTAVTDVPPVVLEGDASAITPEIDSAVLSADTQAVIQADASGVTPDIDAAVAAADGLVPIDSVGAESITGDIDAAVAGADSTVQVDADTAGAADAIAALSANVDPIDVPVDVDASDASASLDELSTSAAGATTGMGAASAGAHELGASTEYLAAGAGLAVGSTGELRNVTNGLEGEAGLAVGAVGALTLGVGELFHAGIDATSAAQRFNMILGEMASRVEQVHVGNLNTTITELGRQMGSTESAMQNATATVFQFSQNAGASKEASAQFTDSIVALAARAVALNPAIGDVADVATRMQVGLGRARSAAQQFGIAISQDEINTRALADTGRDSAGQLTAYEKSVAGAEIALQRYGSTLQGTVATGSQNAAIQQRQLKAELKETIERLGAPLVIPMLDLMKAGLPIAESFGQVLSALAVGALPALTQVLTAASAPLRVLATVLTAIGPALGPLTIGFLAFEAATLGLPAIATLIATGMILMGGAAAEAAVEVDAAAAAMSATPFGLIAAGIAVVVAGLGLFGGAETSVTDKTKKLTDEMVKLNGVKLVEQFSDAAKLRTFSDDVDSTTGRLRTFRTIAEENVGVAQRLFDALKRAGEPTAGYQQILDAAAKSARDSAKAQGETSAATTKLTTDTEALKSTLLSLHDGFVAAKQEQLAGIVAMSDGAAALARYEGGALSLADTEKSLTAAQSAMKAAVLDGNSAYAMSAAAALANKAALDETATSLIASITPLAGVTEGTRAYTAEQAAQVTSNQNATSAMGRYSDGTLSAKEATDALDAAASALKNELDLLFGRFLSADQATNNYQLAVLKLNDELAKNGNSFDAATAAGAENRNTLDSLAEKAISAADAILKQTGSVDQAIAPLQNFRAVLQTLRDTLAAAGGDTAFADAMLGQVDAAIAGVQSRNPAMAAAGQGLGTAGVGGLAFTQADWNAIGALLAGGAAGAVDAQQAAWQAAGGVVAGAGVAGAGGTLGEWINTGTGLGTAGHEGVASTVPVWGATGAQAGAEAAGGAAGQAGQMYGAGVGVGQQGTGGLGAGLAGMPGVAAGSVLDSTNAAALAGANAHNVGYGIGASLSQGIGDGIIANDGYVQSQARQVVNDAEAAAKAAASIGSPSKLFREEVGLPIAQGIALGIGDGSGLVSNATSDLIGTGATAWTPGVAAGGGSSNVNVQFNIQVHGVADPDLAHTVGEQVGDGAVDALSRRGFVVTARMG